MADSEKKVGSPNQTHACGCLVRFGWMLFGNVALITCLIIMFNHRGSFLSVADAVFWTTVGALVWLRHFDVTRMGGRTAEGRPASLSHWKRYTRLLLVFSLLVWSAVHAMTWFRQ